MNTAAMQWPMNGDQDRIFVDDISGYRETLALNSGRLFVGRDVLNIEACLLTQSGASLLLIFNRIKY